MNLPFYAKCFSRKTAKSGPLFKTAICNWVILNQFWILVKKICPVKCIEIVCQLVGPSQISHFVNCKSLKNLNAILFGIYQNKQIKRSACKFVPAFFQIPCNILCHLDTINLIFSHVLILFHMCSGIPQFQKVVPNIINAVSIGKMKLT